MDHGPSERELDEPEHGGVGQEPAITEQLEMDERAFQPALAPDEHHETQ